MQRMINGVIGFAKLDKTLDAQQALDELNKLEQLDWHTHVNKTCYQGEWDVVALRARHEHLECHPILQCFSLEGPQTSWMNLPILERFPCIKAFINSLQCPVRSARLMRLKPKSQILPHSDNHVSIEYGEARLHVPLSFGDEVGFYVEEQCVPMNSGELWYINTHLTHRVTNNSNKSRVNLVIDCDVNEWLACLIKNKQRNIDVNDTNLTHVIG